MRTSELDYDLPPELIAQHPLERRDDSRLLVYRRASEEVEHRRFKDLPAELEPTDLVVVNDTKVVPARLRLRRPGGEAPLPPYITEPLGDPDRYQTVYAEEAGSAAAPTAGLHFTPELLARLDVERITLHVGLDTFRPITAETLAGDEIHSERYRGEPAAWKRIRSAGRGVAGCPPPRRVLG